jgi:hypothetical protein
VCGIDELRTDIRERSVCNISYRPSVPEWFHSVREVPKTWVIVPQNGTICYFSLSLPTIYSLDNFSKTAYIPMMFKLKLSSPKSLFHSPSSSGSYSTSSEVEAPRTSSSSRSSTENIFKAKEKGKKKDKKKTKGVSFLRPLKAKEVKKGLKAISSPKMGSLTPNISTSNLDTQPPYPLHHSIKDRLNPVYAAFYNQHLIDKQQVHLQPVAASRTSGVLIPGGGPELHIGRKEDISIPRRETTGPEIPLRVFTPEGDAPANGWPLMIYYHGGGWVLGNIDTENTVCSHLCKRAECVVVSVDYRYDARGLLSFVFYVCNHVPPRNCSS